jgi:hypothetical protein
MEQLNVLRTLFRDALKIAEPSIIAPSRKDKFLNDVFGKVDPVRLANEEHLLPQLKYRQQEQGPWIKGFSDIFRQWIRKAKAAYIDYASGFPGATFWVRSEIDRNIEFRNFMDRARSDKRSDRLDWSTYLKSPITRLQRYSLLLSTVLRTMKTDSEEKTNLKLAYEEVKAVTLECDARVDEMQRKVDLNDLARRLVLRPGMKNEVTLNLDEYGRQVIYRGELQRMGGNRFTWLDCHGILFDHYLVLAKTVAHRTDQAGKSEVYDVSRLPIPMDLLILESANDPPVQKSSYVKGITSLRDVPAGRSGTPSDPTLVSRNSSNQSPTPQLQSVNTGSSGTSLQTVTSLSEGKDADRIMYPFKVKHLGRDTYTLFAPTEKARKDWADSIVKAKTKHAASLFNQNAEPFKLRVMADSAFVYDGFAGQGGKATVIKGTPVDRAIKEVEQRFKDTGKPGPTCRARVNCATSFTTSGEDGKEMVAVGTDYGVYVSEINNPRGWNKVSSYRMLIISISAHTHQCVGNSNATSHANRSIGRIQSLPSDRGQVADIVPTGRRMPQYSERPISWQQRQYDQSPEEALREQRRRLLRARPNERPNTRLLQEAGESRLRLQGHRTHLPEILGEKTRHVQTRQHGLLPRIR